MCDVCGSSLPFPLYPMSAEQHLPGVWDVEYTFLLASLPCCGVNLSIIGIAQVDATTAFLWNTCCQRDRDAWRFDASGSIVGPRSLDVRAMCQNAARHMFKTLPLLDEIIPDMVANLVNQFAMRVGYLADMRSVDNDFPAIGNRWFGLVHRLGCRPQVVVHLGWGGEYLAKRVIYIGDVELCRQVCCLAPGF